MQCPRCNHEATTEEFGQPAKCPACGVFYEKALKLKMTQETVAAKAAAVPGPVAAKSSVRLTADHVAVAMRGLEGVQPVVVVDIQMRFWSMMVFMVKWMLAAIPATLTFFMIMWGFWKLFSFTLL